MEPIQEKINEIKLSDLKRIEVFNGTIIIFEGNVAHVSDKKTRGGGNYSMVELKNGTYKYILPLFGNNYSIFFPHIKKGQQLKVMARVKKLPWGDKKRFILKYIAMSNGVIEFSNLGLKKATKTIMHNNMEYSKYFKKFVKEGIEQEYYIGIGNPNAKILIIGKEAAISKDDKVGQVKYKENAKQWVNHIINDNIDELDLSYEVKEGEYLAKSWGKNTWSKYQRLSDYIWNKEPTSHSIDFLERIFTTEINDSPSQQTQNSKKVGLKDRKILFEESSFIQNFPVVILACSDYIKNNDKMREIDNFFHVEFDGGEYRYTKQNWFYTHREIDKTKPKLVIHTRQLSANVKEEMIKEMAAVIKKFLNDNNLALNYYMTKI
ncbi:MAG: hypothetical protein GXO79_06620 [Chlorobi bacterium]|nr:hypothetical protein [Chlorobiota bacterium]